MIILNGWESPFHWPGIFLAHLNPCATTVYMVKGSGCWITHPVSPQLETGAVYHFEECSKLNLKLIKINNY